jgi:L-rhamnono-1,4-lactonase
MTPGNPLVREHLLADYLKAARQDGSSESDVEVEGVVYVETDVRYEDPKDSSDVATWARGPLDEISFLRSIVDGKYGEKASKMLLGVVPWAPMNQPASVLREYLRLAEERAGAECWRRTKGFRFLLQFISDQRRFEELVLGDDFIENLKELGRRGLSFDIGVDQRSGGTWQLEIAAQAMERAHQDVPEEERVIFIIDHLCKPAFGDPNSAFELWRNAMTRMSKLSRTYIKLSGAFSELPDGLKDLDAIFALLQPWVAHVLVEFGLNRIMFGSDWPVCNVNGPRKDGSWDAWKDIVSAVVNHGSYHLSRDDEDQIWHNVVQKAYRLTELV